MHHTELNSETHEEVAEKMDPVPAAMTPAERTGGMRMSMHDGVAVWCDCCSCEAEPYWLAVCVASEVESGESPSSEGSC